MPAVTVVMPTFNGLTRGYVRFAIDSVLAQTFRDFELVVVDDGSTDQTSRLSEDYRSDDRLRLVAQPNRGQGAARNKGIAVSSGEFICFLDDDDLWRPNKLEEQVGFFCAKARLDPLTGLVFHAVDWIDGEGKTTGEFEVPEVSGDVYHRMLFDNLVAPTSSVMVLRSAMERVGGFVEIPPPCCAEDYDTWLRIARFFHIYSQPAVLGCYRFHGTGVSRNRSEMEWGEDIVLRRALLADSQASETAILQHWHSKRALQCFHMNDFPRFRRQLRLAAAYGPLNWKLHARFLLSFFPKLVRFLRRYRL